MTYLETIPVDRAEGAVKAMYEKELAEDGHVSNKALLFSHRPETYAAWFELIGGIRRHLRLRRYELVTLAAARALRCRYCVGAHGATLEASFFTRPQLEAMVRDYRASGLPEIDVAVMALAEKVATDAHLVTPDDIAALRSHGLSDADIFDVTLAAAARCFFSKVLDAMGAEPDDEFRELAALVDLIPANQAEAATERSRLIPAGGAA
jgi:uncharacterized peroxidase-related enzyme